MQFADRAVLDKESESRRHQGVIAYTTDYEYFELEDIIAAKKSAAGGFIVLCDGIEDVHNLGSILRVAECAGADGVVIPKAGSAVVTESVVRISAGAAEHVKVAKVPNLGNAVETLKKNGYWVYALEAGGEEIYTEDFSGNVALARGRRGFGREAADKAKVRQGAVHSFAGAGKFPQRFGCAGIAAYEVVRKRLKK